MGDSKHSEILVLGSMALNTLLVPLKDKTHVFQRREGWVGAPLLRKMICQALVENGDDSKRTPQETKDWLDRELEAIGKAVLPDPPDPAQSDLAQRCVRITTVFKQASRTSDPKDRESVLRVEREYTSLADRPDELERSLTTQMRAAVAACPNPDILVLFDFDDAFRAAARSTLAGLTAAAGERITVIGLAAETGESALSWFDALTPEVTGGPERTVAILRAEELRKAGLVIIESGPIERTVRDLFPYFAQPPLRTVSRHAAHLVILFEEQGAIYAKVSAPQTGCIHLSSNCDVIALGDHEKFGRTPGRMSITLTALVRQLAASGGGALPDLSPAVRLSMAASNRYFSDGYGRKPLSTLESVLSYDSRKQLKVLVEGEKDRKPNKAFFISTLSFPMDWQALESWTRLDAVLKGNPDERAARLREIVLRGPEAAFGATHGMRPGAWFPEARIQCPYMQVGALKTFDEEEIAGFTSLSKLFRKYLRTPAWKAPLSIAVFGPPGTGKSFGVRELMKSINPAAEKELTFNLSQLRSVDALNEAFHDVQHRVLSSDDVPLVLFDEFDATFDGEPLGWLKYFLAPMQDGVFRGRASDYRIGRAFFVFAGGTSSSFAEFRKDLYRDEAKSAKLPDFVSRLQGFLDIQSINPPDESDCTPDSAPRVQQRKIKRALLLRSLLLTHAKPIVQKESDEEVPRIDPRLIDAFLNAERYVHGLRSMESVVRMSKWVDGWFIPASLPAKWLLEMHVTGLAFPDSSGTGVR